MSDTKYVIDRDTLVSVGNAIRTKKGSSAEIPVTDLANEISSIIVPSGDKSIVQNGTYDVSAFARAIVDVPGLPAFMDYGGFRVNSNTNINMNNPLIVRHYLNTKPTRFFLFDAEPEKQISIHGLSCAIYSKVMAGKVTESFDNWLPNSSTATSWMTGTTSEARSADNWEITDETVTFGLQIPETTLVYQGVWLLSGHTYMWVALDTSQVV